MKNEVHENEVFTFQPEGWEGFPNTMRIPLDDQLYSAFIESPHVLGDYSLQGITWGRPDDERAFIVVVIPPPGFEIQDEEGFP